MCTEGILAYEQAPSEEEKNISEHETEECWMNWSGRDGGACRLVFDMPVHPSGD